MARAAVRAKQAQKAQAQAAARPSRGQRKHASGGNPNQDLFFTRLRRRQRWVFLTLAILFAVSFTALGVGSGTGGGLSQIWNSILGNGSDAIAQAKSEIKSNPKKGYQDLANAYVTKGDMTSAIATMLEYLRLHKTDAAAWTQVAGYEKTQADMFSQQYQQILASAQLAAPGSLIAPTGKLQGLFPKNPVDDYYAQQSQAQLTIPYQKATTGYNSSLTDYENAAKYAKKSHLNQADADQAAANAAQNAGNTKVALKYWNLYVQLVPNSPNLAQIEQLCKNLGGSCTPKHKPSSKSSH